MQRVSLLVVAGLVLAAASYQMLAADSMATANRATKLHELEIDTRNAAFTAFTRARHLVEDAETFEAFAPPGAQLQGQYEGATYQVHIVSYGTEVTIYSSAVMISGADTLDFSVSARVAWSASPPGEQQSDPEKYLVLKAYHEQ